ncbi:MAG: MerC domain-containing protein [Pseudomonadota bacterium]|nr:MAG: MerC domain-containing protein [Pseudomonadota bacterium]
MQCLLLSLTLLIAPVLSLGVFGSDAFHRVLLAVILPLSVAAFALGYRAHRSAGLLLPGAVGLGLLFLAAFLEARVLGPLTASALTSLGGLCLMAAHWLNLRQRRRARMRPGH